MIILYYYMGKKDQLLSFRTTEGNHDYLKELAESNERTVSYILNKMIQGCRNRGVFDVGQI